MRFRDRLKLSYLITGVVAFIAAILSLLSWELDEYGAAAHWINLVAGLALLLFAIDKFIAGILLPRPANSEDVRSILSQSADVKNDTGQVLKIARETYELLSQSIQDENEKKELKRSIENAQLNELKALEPIFHMLLDGNRTAAAIGARDKARDCIKQNTDPSIPYQIAYFAAPETKNDIRAEALEYLANAHKNPRFLISYGQFLERFGNRQRSEEYLRRAIEILNDESKPQEDRDHLLATTFSSLGVLYHHWERSDEAEKCLRSAQELAERENFETTLSIVKNIQGLMAAQKGDYGNARLLFEKALDLADKNGVERAAAQIVANLANLERRAGNTERARTLLIELVIDGTARGDVQTTALVYGILGTIFVEAKNPDYFRAIDNLEISLGLDKKIGLHRRIFQTATNLAYCAEKLNLKSKRSAYLSIAAQALRQLGDDQSAQAIDLQIEREKRP